MNVGNGKMEMMAQMGAQMLKGGQADKFLGVHAANEKAILERVKSIHRAQGVEMIGEIPEEEKRVEEIRNSILARFQGNFPVWWVKQYFQPGPKAERDADRAAGFADLTQTQWDNQKARWITRQRENGIGGSDEQLVERWIRKTWDVSREEFEALVVHWPEGRESQEMRSIIAGPFELAKEGLYEIEAQIRTKE